MQRALEAGASDDKKVWSDDRLNREKDAQFLLTFLLNRDYELAIAKIERSFVMNLDAGWGTGKTYFLKRLQKEIELRKHLVVYVNAWEDDHADDPLVAVMSAIDEALQPRLLKNKALQKAWRVAKSAGLQIAVTGA